MNEFNIGDIVKLNKKHPFYSELKKHVGIIITINLDPNDLVNFELIKILINNRFINVEFEQIYIPKKYKKK